MSIAPTTHATVAAPAAALPWQIRLLRRLQPVVAWVLRSSLHRIVSHEVLLLTYPGRTTGRTYTLPLSYVPLGEHLYLCTRALESRWWRNLRQPTHVMLRWRGRDLPARAALLDPTTAEARDALRRFVTTNPRTGVMLYGIRPDDHGRPREDELAREVLRSIVVRLTPQSAA